MKKRKPPIIPITILAICAVVAFGYNYKAGINPEAQAKAAPPVSTGDTQLQPRASQAVTSTVSDVQRQLGGASAQPDGPKKSPMANKGAPTIQNTKTGPMKPVPNDTSISSQWYNPASSKSGQ